MDGRRKKKRDNLYFEYFYCALRSPLYMHTVQHGGLQVMDD